MTLPERANRSKLDRSLSTQLSDSQKEVSSDTNILSGIGQSMIQWLGNLFKTQQDPARVRFLTTMAGSSPPRPEEFEALLTLLQEGAMEIQCSARFGSNAVFYAFISDNQQQIGSVYKPVEGEITLTDFPKGTLAGREVAAFLVSEALSWHFVPPTVYRTQAPYGPGSLQVYIDTSPDSSDLDFSGKDISGLDRVALFDMLVNNADRKPGHLRLGNTGGLWLIDHGLCFHWRRNLRTFLWKYGGKPIPQALLADVASFRQRLDSDSSLITALSAYLSPSEISALRKRADQLLTERRYTQC
jgi:hypothetical protein